MRNFVNKYRAYKYKRFTNGLIFAIISLFFSGLCLMGISDYQTEDNEIIFPFIIAVLSMVLGMFSMFRGSEIPKQKI